MPDATTSNLAEFTVSELAFAVKRTVEEGFGLVRVKGEVSGFKRAASGHLYLSLKDDKAVLDAVAWRGSVGRLSFEPADGLEVVCTGRLTTYPGRSKYQLIVERMEPAGVGALMALLEERKRKLAAEGLFEAARKRPLPFLPVTVGVVTSPTGAVIRDILHRLAERFPRHVLVWPVVVQGEGAAEQVAAAIQGFGALPGDGVIPRPDVLIVARGGGSIEDLWAFNEEVVVRAAALSPIPLISAVGHETDTTLIDLVADRRAPTPTAAAEIAVPVRQELLGRVDELLGRLEHGIAKRLEDGRNAVQRSARGLPQPQQILGLAAQRLDDLGERLSLRSPEELVRLQAERLHARHGRLGELVSDRLRRAGQDVAVLRERLVPDLVRGRVLQLARALETVGRHLESLSHERVLERGYVIVRDRAGQVLPRAADLGRETELDLVFADGTVQVSRQAARPRRGRDLRQDQGTLL